jgi:superfamily II DNA or RNA helicase
MASIEVNTLWSDLLTNNEQLLEIAREESSYEVEGWEYIKKFKLQETDRETNPDTFKYWTDWDGRFGVYKEIFNSSGELGIQFPSGLLDRITMRFDLECDEKVAIVNKQKFWKPDKEIDYKPDFVPRDYQTGAIEYIKEHNITRGIFKAPTGSGKTIIGAMLIKKNYVPTLIIVDKTVLVKQWKQALLDVLDIPESEIGIAQGKKNFNPSFITITTQQSLNTWFKNRIKEGHDEWDNLMKLNGERGWGQVIRDEVHHAGSPKGYDIMMNILAALRWGFSATPEDRQDQNLKQIGCIGETIYTVDSERLIAHEFLAKPEITFLPTDRLVFEWHDKYRKIYKEGITYNNKRNQQIVHEASSRGKNKSVLVFVDFIEHGKLLEAMILDSAPMYGITAEFVYGNHPDRDEVFERFESRETNVLIATEGLIGEGYDYKAIDVVIIANGGKGGIRTIQKTGRGMRVTETKKTVDVIDFGDRCKYLGAHAKARYGIWVQWGFEPDISQTPWIEG